MNRGPITQNIKAYKSLGDKSTSLTSNTTCPAVLLLQMSFYVFVLILNVWQTDTVKTSRSSIVLINGVMGDKFAHPIFNWLLNNKWLNWHQCLSKKFIFSSWPTEKQKLGAAYCCTGSLPIGNNWKKKDAVRTWAFRKADHPSYIQLSPAKQKKTVCWRPWQLKCQPVFNSSVPNTAGWSVALCF